MAKTSEETTQPHNPAPIKIADDEREALKTLFALVDTKLAPFGVPPTSSPPEVWEARGLLRRLERFAATL